MSKKQKERQIILASGSPRRREILANAGVAFTVMVTNTDEHAAGAVTPEDYVSAISMRKAEAAAVAVDSKPFVIIAADTMVVIDGVLLGKPRDRADARAMLKRLENKWHQVLTCLTIAYDQNGSVHYRQNVCMSCVKFKPLGDTEIEAYLDTPEPYDKAGAYGIQGMASAFVEKIEGSRDNVIGLPLDTLMGMLSDIPANAHDFQPAPRQPALSPL